MDTTRFIDCETSISPADAAVGGASGTFQVKTREYYEAINWKVDHPKRWHSAMLLAGGDEAVALEWLVEVNFAMANPRAYDRDEKVRAQEHHDGIIFAQRALATYRWDCRRFVRSMRKSAKPFSREKNKLRAIWVGFNSLARRPLPGEGA